MECANAKAIAVFLGRESVAHCSSRFLFSLALLAAVVRYVEWSSDANQAEFTSATKPSAFDPNHSGEFSTLIQALNGRAGCDWKA
jgi:hypothetical protein